MAARIGTRRHAVEALELHNACLMADAPGWRQIGAGGFRNAYLHEPTRVVYKVGTATYSQAHENPVEVRNARSLLRRCANNDQWINEYVRIPLTSGFDILGTLVVAMQFIEGTMGKDAKAPQEAREALFSLKFGDMHGLNYIVDAEGTLWPIDLASPRPGSRDYSGPDRRVLRDSMW